MKVDADGNEAEILSFWEEMEVYEKRNQLNSANPRMVVHLPPMKGYGAAGTRELRSAVIRDIILKYKQMSGFNVPCLPIWNCYDAPAEHAALQALKSRVMSLEM